MTCEHCESRTTCACPAGREVCAVGGACPCGPGCPCPTPEAELPEPKCRRCPAPAFCGTRGILLGAVVWSGLFFLVFWWWEKTPLVSVALLLSVLILVFWIVLMLGYFGRWGRRAVVMINAPPWLWWLWLLLALALFGLGVVALVDGGESRAGVVLVLLAAIFAIGGWARMLPILYRMLPPIVMAPIAAVIVGGAVLGVLGLRAGDETFGAIAALVATLWLAVMVLAPWLLLWRRGVRHQRVPTGIPILMLLAPIVILVVGTLMLIANGYTRDKPGGGAAGAAVETQNDALIGSTSDTTTTSTTTTTTTTTTTSEPPDDAAPPQQQPTYRVAMSDGRMFPIYRFDDGNQQSLGIVLPRPDTQCWLLQYDEGIADHVGTCNYAFVDDVEPVPASIIFESEDRVVALLQDTNVVVSDALTAQGFAFDLDDEFFVELDASGDTVEIDGETFRR